jgi:hypothetical protein
VPSKDESEVPLHKYSWYRAGALAVQSIIGWPLYLFVNASGREYSRMANHFDPFSPIFSKRERPGVRPYCFFRTPALQLVESVQCLPVR